LYLCGVINQQQTTKKEKEMETVNSYKEIGNTTYGITPLQGRKREIVQYAETIASLDPLFWNQYVMAFDYTDEPLWVVNPGDTDLNDIISWDGVKRIEIWDYSTDTDEHGGRTVHRFEFMYYATKKALGQYIESRNMAPARLS
jgi:hypothetical protein